MVFKLWKRAEFASPNAVWPTTERKAYVYTIPWEHFSCMSHDDESLLVTVSQTLLLQTAPLGFMQQQQGIPPGMQNSLSPVGGVLNQQTIVSKKKSRVMMSNYLIHSFPLV